MHPAHAAPQSSLPYLQPSLPSVEGGLTPQQQAQAYQLFTQWQSEKELADSLEKQEPTEEATKRLGYCEKTLRRLRKEGRITGYRTPGTRRVYYKVSDVENLRKELVREDGQLRGTKRRSNS